MLEGQKQSFIEYLQTPTGKMAVMTVLATLIALWFAFNPPGQEKRILDVSVSQNVELNASPTLSKSGSLRFIYNDQQVSNLVSTKIRLKNSGNVPLQQDDFIQSLNISFPNDTRIVNSSLVRAQPLDDAISTQQGTLEKKDNNHLLFTPVLINSSEIFDIDILTTREGLNETQSLNYSPEEVNFDYKIYGITSINRVSKIETGTERHEVSRQKVDGWISNIPVALVVIAIFLAIIAILGSIPSRSKNTNGTNKQSSKIWPTALLTLFWISILLIVLYSFGKIFYEAYFL